MPYYYYYFDSLFDILKTRSFPLLPGLNCGHCGNNNCVEMMASLIAGTNDLDDCEPRRIQESDFKLYVNGENIACVGFVEDIIKEGVSGMISTLKGVNEIHDVKLEYKRR